MSCEISLLYINFQDDVIQEGVPESYNINKSNMATWSAEKTPLPPTFEQQVEDIVEEVESDSASEEVDTDQEKKDSHHLCLGIDDEYVF